ncbi:peptide/nickel transport system permease protein [Allocatelliglobosispora scoriae]|uniref:Peptide/nickel transport system permease protein n=1 Tax=Allocatelliglobosispora scoriae TaxID=643052 RepID=A0A841BJM3_9ACTN|nr:ABC transporter permease [Allocatelliglobosispora scoriae]MBB5867396.1 peptide/nickel transport system permease protein [Allocatelliglobosispora scoriae]
MSAIAVPVGRTRPGLRATGWLAVTVLGAVAATAVLGPWLAPDDPNHADLLASYAAPSAAHWLGTDATGRDVASRLIAGTRTALIGPAAIVALSLLVGVPLALAAAWRGGWAATVVGRAMDLLFAVPALLLGILAVAVAGPGLVPAVAALAIAYLPYVGRLATAAAEAERVKPYVRALEVQGHPALRISLRHILRNIAGPLLGQASVAFAYALLDLAALSFLGLGVQAPDADWGVLVNDRDALLRGHPLGVAAAAVVIVATVLSLFTVGSRVSGPQR